MKVITKFFKKRKKKKEKYSDLQIQEALTQLREALIMQPLDAILHFQYAQAASKANLPFLAYAELKTASVLGLPDKDGQQLYQEIISKVPDLLEMNHNQWFRLHSIASKLKEKADGKKLRILDVGGGDGSLAAFLPEMDYCLVEPDTNGISGTHLPFADQSFDYVVSCHVLEHIPIESRELFLDQLISKASKGLLLLNPFHVEGSFVEERLQLFIDVTNARWAHEHLECSLPKVSDVEAYAQQKGLQCEVEPNGALTTSMALVFMDHFSQESRQHEKWKQINYFINSRYAHLMTSPDFPTAYLICLNRQNA